MIDKDSGGVATLDHRPPSRPAMPGDVLRSLLGDAGMSVRSFAVAAHLSLKPTCDILRGARRVTRRTARKLAAVFDRDERSWLLLQAEWDAWLDEQPEAP